MFGIAISPLSFIPGARVDHHLANLNFFFIRESTSVREVRVREIDMIYIIYIYILSSLFFAVTCNFAFKSYFISTFERSFSLHNVNLPCASNVTFYIETNPYDHNLFCAYFSAAAFPHLCRDLWQKF